MTEEQEDNKMNKIGFIGWDDYNECWTAESDHEVLENVTHFINLTPFDL